DDPARLPEYLSRAFYAAVSGRPGPVVLALPEDVLAAEADVADAGPARAVRPEPGVAAMARLRQVLAVAERPLAIGGGSGWSDQGCADLVAFAEAWRLPVGAAFRRQDVFDNGSDSYVGDVGIGVNPKLAQRIRDCDVLLAIGARLGEATTSGYTLVDVPSPGKTLVHVHPDPDE